MKNILFLVTVFSIVELSYGIKCWENVLGAEKKENTNCKFCGYEKVAYKFIGDKSCDNNKQNGEIRYCLQQSNFDYDTPNGKQNMNDTTACINNFFTCEEYNLSICNWDGCNDKCQFIAPAATTTPAPSAQNTTTTTPPSETTTTSNGACLISFSFLSFVILTFIML